METNKYELTVLETQRAFNDFRRTLRKADQNVFDAVFKNVTERYSYAIAAAEHVLPFEAILLAMVIDLRREIERLNRLTGLDRV